MNEEPIESVSGPAATPAQELQQTFELQRDALRRLLWGLLRNDAQVEDALQTTFLRLVEWQAKQKASFAHGEVRAWLFRVAVNEALLVKRKRQVEIRHQAAIAWWLEQRGTIDQDSRGANDESPAAGLLRAERQTQLQRLLEQLPAEQREVVRLRIYEDLKFVEIAERLQVPLGTVLTRMRVALAKLKSGLESQE